MQSYKDKALVLRRFSARRGRHRLYVRSRGEDVYLDILPQKNWAMILFLMLSFFGFSLWKTTALLSMVFGIDFKSYNIYLVPWAALLIFWLCVSFVLLHGLIWQLAGRENILISRRSRKLTHQKAIWKLRWSREFDLEHVVYVKLASQNQSLGAYLVSCLGLKFGAVAVGYDNTTYFFGHGLDEAEAHRFFTGEWARVLQECCNVRVIC